jgi:uncharacterized protein YbjQ (UPF0145 family)
MTKETMSADASARLAQSAQGLFTSDLSVNEFALLTQAGFQPLGLVMGSSIYHIGLQTANWGQNQELTVISQAMYNARELAMTRMQHEADALQADGIVGVRLDATLAEWGESLAEFVAVGTAVRAPAGEPHRAFEGGRNSNARPFTSDLSGQDMWTLRQIGYRPVGLVMGTCVYHVAHQGFMQALRTLGRNTEMTNYSQALYHAREIAMRRMQAEAERLSAKGIVGVRVVERTFGWGSHVIEFMAIGTAVVALEGSHNVIVPTPTISLNG